MRALIFTERNPDDCYLTMRNNPSEIRSIFVFERSFIPFPVHSSSALTEVSIWIHNVYPVSQQSSERNFHTFQFTIQTCFRSHSRCFSTDMGFYLLCSCPSNAIRWLQHLSEGEYRKNLLLLRYRSCGKLCDGAL